MTKRIINIKQVRGTSVSLFSCIKEADTLRRSFLKRGFSKDFDAGKLICGQAAFILDTKELCFCFSDGTCERLKLSEEITKERADELINLIVKYIDSDPRFK